MNSNKSTKKPVTDKDKRQTDKHWMDLKDRCLVNRVPQKASKQGDTGVCQVLFIWLPTTQMGMEFAFCDSTCAWWVDKWLAGNLTHTSSTQRLGWAVSSLGHSEVEKRETKWGYEQNQLGKQLSVLSPLYRKKADTTYLLVEREEIMREGDRETDRLTNRPINPE